LAESLSERAVLRPGFTTASSSISLRRLLAILVPAGHAKGCHAPPQPLALEDALAAAG
jgi:hypothetical protein